MDKRPLKEFIRQDGNLRDVGGSNVWRKSKPKNGRWREVSGYECCNLTTTTTSSTSTSTSTTSTTTTVPIP